MVNDNDEELSELLDQVNSRMVMKIFRVPILAPWNLQLKPFSH